LFPDTGAEEPAAAEIVSLRDRSVPEGAVKTLLDALDTEGAGKTIAEELGSLLFPRDKPEGQAAMQEAVREAIRVALRDGASRG
jgi:hypothetical protein